MTFTGARYSSPYGCSVCYKCNGDGKAYMTLYGFVYYAFTALIEKETFCDGSVREVVTEANYGWVAGYANPCLYSDSRQGENYCRTFDTRLETFVPVEECYNRLTGLYESCAQNCSEPVKKGGVEEICGNGIDDNCNGQRDEGCAVCVDADSDGNSAYDPITCPGGNDCDDGDPFKNRHNYDNDGYSTCDGDCDEDPVTGPGTYPGANDICDGKDNNCNADVDEDCCEVDTVSVNPPWVRPKGTGGYTQAEVSVTLFRPAPPGGCTVDLIVEPVENSGGHKHDGARPKGNIIPPSIGFSYGETEKDPEEPKPKYVSSKFSGEEKIKATIQDGRGDEAEIEIKVPNLTTRLGGGYYNLKCNIQDCSNYKHEDFYNVQSWVKTLFDRIAYLYRERFPDDQLLVVTDGSMRKGGLYDYKDTWTTPHIYHRIGTDIDVRSKNMSEKNKYYFKKFICKDGGFPALEYPGGANEHYHLYFYAYSGKILNLCKEK